MTDTLDLAPAAETEPCAAAVRDAEGDQLAGQPWMWSNRNTLAPTAAPQALDWKRIVALSLALGLHVGVLLFLLVPAPAWPPLAATGTGGPSPAIGTPRDALRVVFFELAASADPGDVGVVRVTPSSALSALEAMRPAPHALATPPAPSPVAPVSAPPAVARAATVAPRDADVLPSAADALTPAARLFFPDGSVALPVSAIEDLRSIESEDRAFDYMTPGRVSAASAFTRRPTLTYEPTRFDADWKPVRTLGDDVLTSISEVLTYENERKSFRCSVLPPGCSWGRVVAAVELDDPHTLNPVEDAQCRGLLDAIVAATDQGEWLKLRARFDVECRKPLTRDRTPPAPRAMTPAPG